MKCGDDLHARFRRDESIQAWCSLELALVCCGGLNEVCTLSNIDGFGWSRLFLPRGKRFVSDLNFTMNKILKLRRKP